MPWDQHLECGCLMSTRDQHPLCGANAVATHALIIRDAWTEMYIMLPGQRMSALLLWSTTPAWLLYHCPNPELHYVAVQ